MLLVNVIITTMATMTWEGGGQAVKETLESTTHGPAEIGVFSAFIQTASQPSCEKGWNPSLSP